MAGAMRKMMEYLSFAEPQDELYDDEPVEARREVHEVREARPVETATSAPREGSTRVEAAARPERNDPMRRSEPEERAERTERMDRIVDEHRAQVTPITSRLGHELNRIVTVHPTSYNEARTIGEAFREGTPVIMNLTDLGEGDAKRMVDFAAGLVFGLYGTIERVTSRVFLLSPATVDVETEGEPADGHAGRFYQQS